MKILPLALTVLVLPVAGLPAQAQNTRDDAAVRAVIARYVEAREKIEPAAVEALFTPDADQLVSSGEWRRGRAAVVEGTTTSSRSNSGRRTITIETVRFLAPTVAIADGRYELAGAAGSEARKMWTSIILTRGSGGWRIAAIRNMLPTAQK